MEQQGGRIHPTAVVDPGADIADDVDHRACTASSSATWSSARGVAWGLV